MRVSRRKGRLSSVTAVARVLPRDWDGHRFLRFLTGLAMLALAFAAHAAPARLETAAPAPAPAVAPARAPAASAVAAVAPADRVEAHAPGIRTTPPVIRPVAVPAHAVGVAVIVVLAGVALRVPAGRGPPTR